jgi:hypothetical protein
LSEGFSHLRALSDLVLRENACVLPGVSIDYHLFISYMWHAVDKGWVTLKDARFVAEGLRFGFDLRIDPKKLEGQKRIHANYKSALDYRSEVTKAIMKRVSKGKTMILGEWGRGAEESIPCPDYTIFSIGGLPTRS